MQTQLSGSHGDIGNSVSTVDKLISEHSKFMETAKVGCGGCEHGGCREKLLLIQAPECALVAH